MRIFTLITGLAPVAQAIKSAEEQTVKNNIVTVVDNCEAESSFQVGKLFQWNRSGRHHKAKNILDVTDGVLRPILHEEDVICLLDGDDTYADRYSLEPIRKLYQDKNVWLTYGSYKNLSGNPGTFGGRYHSGSSFRSDKWKASHLKTFRYGLFRHLAPSSFKGPDGAWLEVCSDLAIMFPLLEMAGLDRIRYVEKITYTYNDLSPFNDHKVSGQKQLDIAKWIRQKPHLSRLDSL